MGFWNSIGNGIKRIAKKTWNGIKNVGGRIATTGARVFNTIGGGIKKASDFVYNIPIIGGIAKGFAGGITDNLSNGLTSTGNLLGNLRDGKYKEALGNAAGVAGNVAGLASGPLGSKFLSPEAVKSITNGVNGVNLANNVATGNFKGAIGNAQVIDPNQNRQNIYKFLKN